jgi:hypothetical protein
MRFADFYFMTGAPERIATVATQHALGARTRTARVPRPFGDRSGGLITLEAASRDDAERLVAQEPFLREGLLQGRWVKDGTSTER